MSKCYKYCFVPGCESSTIRNPNKLFVTVPYDIKRRKLWMDMARRDEKINPSRPTTRFSCCEDHFEVERDFENYQYVKMFHSQRVKIKLRDDAIPSKFDCQKNRLLTGNSQSTRTVVSKLERKKLVQNLLSSSEPNKRTCETEDIEEIRAPVVESEELFNTNLTNNPSKGIQVQPEMADKNVQAKPSFKSKFVQVNVSTKSTLTSPLKRPGTLESSLKTKILRLDPSSLEDEEEQETEVTTSSSVFTVTSDQVSSPSSQSHALSHESHKEHSSQLTVFLIETKPKLYIGIPPECLFIITLLSEHTNIQTRDVMIVLKKLRCNHPFSMLGDDFGLSQSQVSKIFRQSCPLLASYLKKLVYWPDNFKVKLNLPIPFRKNYHEVDSIIDCLEVQIEKRSNPYVQALTWSNYYQCNTIKFLISVTPNGFINFLSQGYGGRISDKEITIESGYLNYLPSGKSVMADRGFKHLDLIFSKRGNKLVRPPSVKQGQKLSKIEATEARRIASLRVHVERVIGRIREFKMLLPHSTVDANHVPYLDCIINCVAGLVNIQSLIL